MWFTTLRKASVPIRVESIFIEGFLLLNIHLRSHFLIPHFTLGMKAYFFPLLSYFLIPLQEQRWMVLLILLFVNTKLPQMTLNSIWCMWIKSFCLEYFRVPMWALRLELKDSLIVCGASVVACCLTFSLRLNPPAAAAAQVSLSA